MLPTRINRFRTLWPAELIEVDRLFDDVLTHPSTRQKGWIPSADLYETSDEFRVELDLPGFDVADVNVTVERGMLTVTGVRALETEREGENCHARERRVGKFEHGFPLPDNVDAEKVRASLERGVLKVLLPKLAEAKPKQIEVTVE